MNFAKQSPEQTGSCHNEGSSYKDSEKRYGRFSSQEGKKHTEEYLSIRARFSISRTERPVRPRLP